MSSKPDCAWCGKNPSKSWIIIGGRYFCNDTEDTCPEQYYLEMGILSILKFIEDRDLPRDAMIRQIKAIFDRTEVKRLVDEASIFDKELAIFELERLGNYFAKSLNWKDPFSRKELSKNILSCLMILIGDKIPSVDRIVLQNYISGKFTDPKICRSSLLVLVGFGLHELSSVKDLEHVKHVQSFLDSQNPESTVTKSDGT